MGYTNCLSTFSYTDHTMPHPVLGWWCGHNIFGTTKMNSKSNISSYHRVNIITYRLTKLTSRLNKWPWLVTRLSIKFPSYTLLEDRWRFTHKAIFMPSYFGVVLFCSNMHKINSRGSYFTISCLQITITLLHYWLVTTQSQLCYLLTPQ